MSENLNDAIARMADRTDPNIISDLREMNGQLRARAIAAEQRLAAAEAERDDAKRILAIAVGRDEGVLSHIISELKQRLAAAEARLRRYEPEPGKCEHGVAEGDWCEPCNKAYKDAADEAAKGDVR